MPAAASAHRAVYRAPEVCEIADVQPYVLRSWELEFPDLGVSKTADGPRLYRKADVDLVLKIKHLLLDEGLTLAGARKQLVREGDAEEIVASDALTITEADMTAVIDRRTVRSIHDVREGLGWILQLLGGQAPPVAGRTRVAKTAARAAKSSRKAKPVKSRFARKAAKPARRKKR
jgi:DNA-binding transcriptional MerR regulator